MSRAVAEMIPAVTEPPSPNGLPIASTQSPTRAFDESPQLAAGSGAFGSTLRSARSVIESRPITWACSEVSSDRVTVMPSALAITWLLVTISPDGSTIKPEPSEAARGPLGLALSPKKSRKKSSSEESGEGGCASAVFFGGGTIALVVEMLTTTPTSRPASCEKTSANCPGVCGAGAGGITGASEGCARPAAAGASDSANKRGIRECRKVGTRYIDVALVFPARSI